jgi:FKBP-type peptidyl-prolyl cis-trans isomerase 2
MKQVVNILSVIMGIFLVMPVAEVSGESEMIAAGKKVTFDYILMVEDQQVDSSEASGPFEYIHGEGRIVPGLEKQLEGLTAGDEKTIIVTPEGGYGEVNPEAFREVPKATLPQDLPLEVGRMLRMKTPDGQDFPVLITEVKEDSVILDFNHPLAGKTLQFDVTIVKVQ